MRFAQPVPAPSPHPHPNPEADLSPSAIPQQPPLGGGRSSEASGSQAVGVDTWPDAIKCESICSRLHEPFPLGSRRRRGTGDLWEPSQGTCKPERRFHCPLNSLTNNDHLLWEQNGFVCEFSPSNRRILRQLSESWETIQVKGPYGSERPGLRDVPVDCTNFQSKEKAAAPLHSCNNPSSLRLGKKRCWVSSLWQSALPEPISDAKCPAG